MKKPSSVAVFIRPVGDHDVTYIKKTLDILTSHGIRVFLLKGQERNLTVKDGYAFTLMDDEKEMIQKADMVLVLGGDGTMIQYSVLAAELGKPTAGVNLGTLGFLTALERDEIDSLSLLCDGNYSMESRMLFDVTVEDEKGVCLLNKRIMNDVVVASGIRSKIGEFTLISKEGKLLGYKADGIIVATPTGSTAYSFSAGGPVVDPTAEIISVTPLCPHSLLRGSVLLNPNTELTVCGRTRDLEHSDFHFAMDGQVYGLFPETTKVKIKKSAYTAKIVKIKNNRFYDILETKLNTK